MLARAVDLLQVGDGMLLAQVLRVLLQHFAVTDDGIERRAQLVAHVGEKGALGPIGLLGGGFGLLGFGGGAGQFGGPFLHFFFQVLVVNFEHVIGVLQLGVPLLDDRQHLVERVNEGSDFVVAHLVRPHQIVLFFSDHLRHAHQVHDRLGDQRLKLVGNEESHQAGNQHHHDHDVGVAIEPRLQLLGQVGLEIDRADPFPVRNNRPENAQVIAGKTVFQLGRLGRNGLAAVLVLEIRTDRRLVAGIDDRGDDLVFVL